MTPGQLTGPLTQFQANALSRDGIAKVLSTINKGLGERRIEPQQMEEILDVWWPKLQERLQVIPAAPTPTATRTTSDQLEELLALAREQLRRENIRLEGSKERDDKLNSMLELMEKAGATLGAVQGQSQRLQSAMAKPFESALANPHSIPATDLSRALEMIDAAKGLASSVGPGQLDSNSIKQMAELMRTMQDRDKERVRSILTPPSEGTPGA